MRHLTPELASVELGHLLGQGLRAFAPSPSISTAALALCGLAACSRAEAPPRTTDGAIAIANLDAAIARRGDQAGVEELLLARSRFLGDDRALDRAVALAEGRAAIAGDLLRRARTRAAVHRFAEALADLDAAERAGADAGEVAALRASVLVAVGRAGEVITSPTPDAGGLAARSALAGAYAAVGRLAEADQLYAAVLADLDTTSPFPHAWIYFARGALWAEIDPARAEVMVAQAVALLPAFAAANVHLAELETARGDRAAAIARLERTAAASREPEALALLGALHLSTGEAARGRREIARAKARFEALLARHPLAFADHAAEFYLGPGADPARAWQLARQNLAARPTERAVRLAIRAARASGHDREARALAGRLTDSAGSPGPGA
jgi:hypothetical protein